VRKKREQRASSILKLGVELVNEFYETYLDVLARQIWRQGELRNYAWELIEAHYKPHLEDEPLTYEDLMKFVERVAIQTSDDWFYAWNESHAAGDPGCPDWENEHGEYPPSVKELIDEQQENFNEIYERLKKAHKKTWPNFKRKEPDWISDYYA
jgi:hypothetical protein